MSNKLSYKSLPQHLQNNKPGPTRTHTIVMEEQQLYLIRLCVSEMMKHPEVSAIRDQYDNPVADFLVKMITDTCAVSEEDYDHDMVHGFCI